MKLTHLLRCFAVGIPLLLCEYSANCQNKAEPNTQFIGGSHCGLTDMMGTRQWVETKPGLDLSRPTKALLRTLPKKLRAAITQTLQEFKECSTEMECLKNLAAPEVGPDLYWYRVRNQSYIVLSYVAGGNRAGWILNEETYKIVADLSDGEVYCRD